MEDIIKNGHGVVLSLKSLVQIFGVDAYSDLSVWLVCYDQLANSWCRFSDGCDDPSFYHAA